MNIWYMFDNHTFEQINETDRQGLLKHARKLFDEDGCGSLFVRDEFGASLNKLTLHGELLGRNNYGISQSKLENWVDEILAERSFRTLMA